MTPVISDPESVEAALSDLARTTEEVVTLQELRQLLLSGRRLRMKYGVDLTAPELHLGHAVNLWLYRRLQELGHTVILLLGDFTTQIGDPTGRSRTRPVLPPEAIQRNADALLGQALRILLDDDDVLQVRRNSAWSDRLSAKDLLSLLSGVTVERLLSREMFRRRQEQGADVYAHELVYPLLQGYDSYALQADLTIIGTDQLFNEMMGRWIQERLGQRPQVVLTTTITPGIDGLEKQSKSLGNYIAILHSPRDKFGRVMRIPDHLVADYARVFTVMAPEQLEEVRRLSQVKPMEAKLRLATQIVRRYHGDQVAAAERAWFERTFSERKTPEELPQLEVVDPAPTALSLLRAAFPSEEKSNSELRRLITQGAVQVDGTPVRDPEAVVGVPPGGVVVKVGKRRWFRVVARPSTLGGVADAEGGRR
jgi:tyrosyl-tRNA synthetase